MVEIVIVAKSKSFFFFFYFWSRIRNLGACLALVATLVFLSKTYKSQLTRRLRVNPILKEIEIWKKTASSLIHQDEAEVLVREKLLDHVRHLENQLRNEHLFNSDNESDFELSASDCEGYYNSVASGTSARQRQPSEKKRNDYDVSQMEAKYLITNKPLFIKASAVLLVVILLFFLHPFIDTVELSLPWISITGALVLLLIADMEDLHIVLEKVELGTLLFFAGLFILVRVIEEMGVITWLAELTINLVTVVPEVIFAILSLSFCLFLKKYL